MASPGTSEQAFSLSSHADVRVRDFNSEFGNEAAIKIDPDKTLVKDLKQKFAKMTCTLFTSLHLMVDKKELENDKRLSQYNLASGCIVPCVSGSRRMSFGAPSMHVPQRKLEANGHSANGHNAELSPVWRRADPGLWLEGKCENNICVAYSKTVVMNAGFTDLDFISEKRMIHKSKCPMCYEKVTPISFGFNRCIWDNCWPED